MLVNGPSTNGPAEPGHSHRVMAVLWDVDGTLIDSELLYVEAMQLANRRLGLAGTPGVEAAHGTDAQDIWTAFTGQQPEGAGFRRWHALVEATFIEFLGRAPGLADAIGTLRALNSAGIPQACVSNSISAAVERSLAVLGIRPLIQVVVARDLVERGKPHPDSYLKACELLGVPASACLAVEDSPTGAAAARAAGAIVLARPLRPGGVIDLPDAHVLVEDLTDFPWGLVFPELTRPGGRIAASS